MRPPFLKGQVIAMVLLGIVRKQLEGCGRDSDRTYSNVVVGVQSSPATREQIVEHPEWSKPDAPEFAVILTPEQFSDLQTFDAKFHHDHANLPRYQQREARNGADAVLGSHLDPTDPGSFFSPGESLPDDRYVVKVFDEDGQLSRESLNQRTIGSFVPRHIQIFDGDQPADFQGKQLVSISGKQLLLDFEPGAIAEILISTERAGEVHFSSDSRFRVMGVQGEGSIIWQVFGRTLNVRR